MLRLDGDRTGLEEGHFPPQLLGPLLDEVALIRVENTPVPGPQARDNGNGSGPE
jgi:hypothetical protein